MEKHSGFSEARKLVNLFRTRRNAIAQLVSDARKSAGPNVQKPGSIFTREYGPASLTGKEYSDLAEKVRAKALKIFPIEAKFGKPGKSPSVSLFRGSHRLSATGPGRNPALGYGRIDTPHVKGSQYAHATGDVYTATRGTYGDLLEVYNAKRVPGAMSGKLRWFKDTGAQSVANEDFSAVKGLYTGNKDPDVVNKLKKGISPGYETLIQTSRLQPDRLYRVLGANGLSKTKYMDITSLKDMYFTAKTNQERRLIGELIRIIGGGGRTPVI